MKTIQSINNSKVKRWLSLHFYQLPLDIFVTEQENAPPLAIVEDFRIIYCNLSAQEYGISSNLKVATAYALCADLIIKKRNHSLESKHLLELANITYKFSSQVCLYDEKTILLEINGSNKLFLGLASLLEQLKRRLKDIPFLYSVSIAETPKKSFLLSISNPQNNSLTQLINNVVFYKEYKLIEESEQQLYDLPIDVIAKDNGINSFHTKKRLLGLSKNILKTKRMGIKKMGELMSLPNTSIGRRFGEDFLTYIHQLKGQRDDCLNIYIPAEVFNIQRCFLSGLDVIEQILFPARVMLESLVNFLNLRRKTASKIKWRFECFNNTQISFTLALTSQTQNTQSLMALTQLKLQSLKIEDKIEMIFLDVDEFYSKKENQCTLDLPDLLKATNLSKTKEAFTNLNDRLNIRLKKENYLRLSIHDEYLPEKRSRTYSPQQATPHTTRKEIEHTLIVDRIKSNLQPLWLMDNPTRINHHLEQNIQRLNYKGLLTIKSNAEKIETYWWDCTKESQTPCKSLSKRDYFIAENNDSINKRGIKYWIFYEHSLKQWFVHGVF